MIYIQSEFLRGARAAAKWAHDNYDEPEQGDILDAVIAEEVRGEWAKEEADA